MPAPMHMPIFTTSNGQIIIVDDLDTFIKDVKKVPGNTILMDENENLVCFSHGEYTGKLTWAYTYSGYDMYKSGEGVLGSFSQSHCT